MVRRFALPLLVLAVALSPGVAGAHEERPSQFPSGKGEVPRYRTSGPTLLVCKGGLTLRRIEQLRPAARARNLELYDRCREDGFRHIQEAIDAVSRRGTRILVLPGVYREHPSRRRPRGGCAKLELEKRGEPLSYAEHKRCPHVRNLIAILGDGPDENIACDRRLCDLQIEGTGAQPEDVIIDNGFSKLNGVRADRADGVYFRNFTVQEAHANALYVIETDGFVIDRVVGRWADEYAFLTFATDHGLYKRCEAYGSGDGGIYPGSAADHGHDRPAIEIRRCNSHHNTIGYSGTAGNSVFAHHNRFHHNMVGVTMDSFFPDHPGLPQDSATFRHNRIWANNQDYYRYWRDGTCDKITAARKRFPDGVVCPVVQVPIGTGIMVAGGNQNWFIRNHIWDNWRYGTYQFGVPASFREEEDPSKEFDTSHFNEYLRNVMGLAPRGAERPNGLDFWWDRQGTGNCWEDNEAAPGRQVTSNASPLPVCVENPPPGAPVAPEQVPIAPCAAADAKDPSTYDGCPWFERPERPE